MAKKKPKYWSNGKIPAELFFEILVSGEVSRLVTKGKLSKANQEKAWDAIFDEFFMIEDSGKLRLILRTQEKIRALQHKLTVADNVLKILLLMDSENVPQKIVNEICDSLGKINIKINPESSIEDQVLQLKDFHIAHLETELELEKDNLKNLCKGQKTTFEEGLVAIENALGRSLGEDLSLRKYCALKKSAIDKSKQIKKKRE